MENFEKLNVDDVGSIFIEIDLNIYLISLIELVNKYSIYIILESIF